MVLIVAVAACDAADPAPMQSAAARCIELQEQYDEIILQLDDSCSTADDCALAGGVSSCDCEPYLGPSCWGQPVNGAALSDASAMLGPIVSEFRANCYGFDLFEIGSVCDCEPWAVPTCENNHCGYDVGEWCLGPICDAVDQTGCGVDEKCTWVQIDSANDVGTLDCVANGAIAVGEACTYGADGQSTGFDDCAAGGICVDGTCRTICHGSPDSCTAPETCVAQPGIFPDTSDLGACTPPI